MIKYVGPVIIYYLFMMLDGKILGGLFECERLKPPNIRTSQGNIQTLTQLKQIINTRLKISLLGPHNRENYICVI